jgi:mannose-6-phosphate isomerase
VRNEVFLVFKAYPIRFKEIYKEVVWGGSRLKTLLGKAIPGDKTGESWEISDHGADTSVVAEGAYAGETLRTLREKYPVEILGTALASKYKDCFPLLLKFIDTDDTLSVQVHPDDAYACAHEHGACGKTEAWYIIHAEPGARLIKGLKAGTRKQDFKRLLAEGRVEECLNSFEAVPGDVIPIAAGTLHAIGKGILLAEIQQTSDLTYRVHDWGRMGLDGKPRQMHLEKALDVIHFGVADDCPKVPSRPKVGMQRMAECCQLALDVLTLEGGFYESAPCGERFEVLCAVEGRGSIVWQDGGLEFKAGTSFLVPAAIGSYSIKSNSRCRVLRCSVPE